MLLEDLIPFDTTSGTFVSGSVSGNASGCGFSTGVNSAVFSTVSGAIFSGDCSSGNNSLDVTSVSGCLASFVAAPSSSSTFFVHEDSRLLIGSKYHCTCMFSSDANESGSAFCGSGCWFSINPSQGNNEFAHLSDQELTQAIEDFKAYQYEKINREVLHWIENIHFHVFSNPAAKDTGDKHALVGVSAVVASDDVVASAAKEITSGDNTFSVFGVVVEDSSSINAIIMGLSSLSLDDKSALPATVVSSEVSLVGDSFSGADDLLSDSELSFSGNALDDNEISCADDFSCTGNLFCTIDSTSAGNSSADDVTTCTPPLMVSVKNSISVDNTTTVAGSVSAGVNIFDTVIGLVGDTASNSGIMSVGNDTSAMDVVSASGTTSVTAIVPSGNVTSAGITVVSNGNASSVTGFSRNNEGNCVIGSLESCNVPSAFDILTAVSSGAGVGSPFCTGMNQNSGGSVSGFGSLSVTSSLGSSLSAAAADGSSVPLCFGSAFFGFSNLADSPAAGFGSPSFAGVNQNPGSSFACFGNTKVSPSSVPTAADIRVPFASFGSGFSGFPSAPESDNLSASGIASVHHSAGPNQNCRDSFAGFPLASSTFGPSFVPNSAGSHDPTASHGSSFSGFPKPVVESTDSDCFVAPMDFEIMASDMDVEIDVNITERIENARKDLMDGVITVEEMSGVIHAAMTSSGSGIDKPVIPFVAPSVSTSASSSSSFGTSFVRTQVASVLTPPVASSAGFSGAPSACCSSASSISPASTTLEDPLSCLRPASNTPSRFNGVSLPSFLSGQGSVSSVSGNNKANLPSFATAKAPSFLAINEAPTTNSGKSAYQSPAKKISNCSTVIASIKAPTFLAVENATHKEKSNFGKRKHEKDEGEKSEHRKLRLI